MGTMWAEIPNYERHVFLPIKKNGRDSDEKELTTTLRVLTLDEESEPQEKKIARSEETNGETKIPSLTLIEDELARLSEEDSPEPSPTTFSSTLRCPAPTPESMRKGKTEEESDFSDTEQDEGATKPQKPIAHKKEKSNKGNSKHKVSTSKQSPKDKHPRSSRPEGMPPLNLEGVDRQVEAVPSSPRLLSPRVQKPPSPSNNDSSKSLRPDQSRAVPSIQSPRSAFSITITSKAVE